MLMLRCTLNYKLKINYKKIICNERGMCETKFVVCRNYKRLQHVKRQRNKLKQHLKKIKTNSTVGGILSVAFCPVAFCPGLVHWRLLIMEQ